ncbi:MAG: DUF3256 family protein [Proteiniphilum sp.]|nr:DUF3256 family protein [Proteiniphilum sp.]
MQRNILFIFLFLSLCSYGQTIGDLFRSMPSGLLPGVSENNKTMLLVDTGKTVVPYAMGEVQKLRQSNDFLQIRTSAVGTTQLKMLPVAEDSVIVCLIKTVCGDICDSNITFYTTDWEILQKKQFMPLVAAENFFDSSQKEANNYKYALSLPDIYPISAEFSDGSSDLTLRFNYREYLNDDQIAEIQPYLKSDSIILKWNNATFR